MGLKNYKYKQHEYTHQAGKIKFVKGRLAKFFSLSFYIRLSNIYSRSNTTRDSSVPDKRVVLISGEGVEKYCKMI